MATRRKLDSYLATHSYLGDNGCATLVDYEMGESMKGDSESRLLEFPHLRRWRSHVLSLIAMYSKFDFRGQPLPAGDLPLVLTPDFEVGQVVRVAESEDMVKEAFSSCSDVWWTQEMYKLLGAVGTIKQLDDSFPHRVKNDELVKVGDWLLAKPVVLQRTISGFNHHWLPTAALSATSREDGNTARCSEPWRDESNSTLVSEIANGGKCGLQSLPFQVDVITMSGNKVADVSITSFQSSVRELKYEIARQANIIDVDTVVLFGEGDTTPWVDTARLSLYESKLSACQRLLCVFIPPAVVHWDLPTTYTYEQHVEENVFKWVSKKLEEHFESQSSVIVKNVDGDVCDLSGQVLESLTQRKLSESNFPVTVAYREQDEQPKSNRVLKEVEAHQASYAGMPLTQVMKNLHCWEVSFPGPIDSPYEDGTFLLSFRFHRDHPYKPPHARFITKVYHCNISSETGVISLDILADQWSPALTLSKTVLGIQSLLDQPNPADPIEVEIARLFIEERAQHDANAREWVLKYAT